MKDINSLSHSKWRCQYHIVFAPKYRRQVIYQEIKADIGQILRKLCEQKGVEIIEAKCVSGSYSHDGEYPTKAKRSRIYGILKREE